MPKLLLMGLGYFLPRSRTKPTWVHEIPEGLYPYVERKKQTVLDKTRGSNNLREDAIIQSIIEQSEEIIKINEFK